MAKEYSIYALIDPRTDKVFYIGATKCDLRKRLSGHCAKPQYNLGNGTLMKKYVLIYELLSEGLRPKIQLLKEVSLKSVDKWERYYYNYYKKLGNELFQDARGFVYNTQAATRLKSKIAKDNK